ncbi:hypothetical protein [Pseudoalteromonas marina]|uniref:Uncharacterized protein n=1 Tax=Pseudoalteromonas marina TaxID=267375 RepID=A0ABT9FI25_9GAMM|nr:hypothetical protein [Pseudoalteromonas marina]MDP2566438.1 hypothetical protein [Pseudoalteromonas marina]
MSLNLFINLRCGVASINSTMFENAKVVGMADILTQFADDDSETLTASLDAWIDSEARSLLIELDKFQLNSAQELKDYLLNEVDFLDVTLGELELDHTEDPEIRAYQLSSFDDYSYKRFGQPCY